MAAALGTTNCSTLGCSRKRHVTPTGITYGKCLAHTLHVLSGAFGSGQGAEPAGVPPVPVAFGSLPGVVNARPAA